MYFLTVQLKDFSAAHRLVKGYRGKCNSLHGHNYFLKVVIAADAVGQDGLVVDFSDIRTLSNAWVQTHLDHTTLVYSGDAELRDFLVTKKQKYYELMDNTSVEILAREIYLKLNPIFEKTSREKQHVFSLHQVELWESRECGVMYTEDQVICNGVSCGKQ